MSEEEYESLKGDIRANGLANPIITFAEWIIDGRHRYYACNEVGAKPVFREYEGATNDEAIGQFIISQNFHRRNLAPSQQATIAVEIMRVLSPSARERLIHGLQKKHIEIAGIARDKQPDLFERMKAGVVTMRDAALELKEQIEAEHPKADEPKDETAPPPKSKYEAYLLAKGTCDEMNSVLDYCREHGIRATVKGTGA